MVTITVSRVQLVSSEGPQILVWTYASLRVLADLMRSGQIVYGESYRRLPSSRTTRVPAQLMRYGDPEFRFRESVVRNRAVAIVSDPNERLATWRVDGFSTDEPIAAGCVLHIDPSQCSIQLTYTGVEHTALVRLMDWSANPETIPAAFRMRRRWYTCEQIQQLLPHVAEIAMPLVIHLERPHIVSVIPTPN